MCYRSIIYHHHCVVRGIITNDTITYLINFYYEDGQYLYTYYNLYYILYFMWWRDGKPTKSQILYSI